MTNPTSIRNHAHRVLVEASTSADGGAQARITASKTLLEIADKLEIEQAKKTNAPVPSTPGDIDNVMEFSEEVRKELQARRYVTRNQGK